ncbi:LEM-3-like GIY-YIG domain-containing protein [Paramicrobacterium agarici]|uniref:LEM-3-like GIY-YIG domain-containing protein n=1 Tax=Paramicrobacterium agarici TaxID=630514 RepID=UPI0011542DBD|nr:hypothetical protein [Microbacterium agarici]TQO22910.1 hypothetical protein FB385_1753 [Microbacterium agarici]
MSDSDQRFTSPESSSLGYYVYVYIDPRNDKPFYIGKGKGNRAFAHLDDASENEKVARIAEIRAAGLQPRIELLATGLDEKTAFKVEAASIDLIGFENLTNRVIGHGARKYGRRSVDAVHASLAADPLSEIHHNLVIIRVGASIDEARERLGARFETDSPEARMALYEATRGAWRVSKAKADAAELALAYYDGVIREVYRIATWLPAGSTMYTDGIDRTEPDRMEFVGSIAEEPARRLYRLKDASHLFAKGDVNPVRYFWV